MIVKLFEVRDSATFMPVMAVRLLVKNSQEQDHYLLRRAGYGSEQILGLMESEPYIILTKLDGVTAQYDPYSWTGRTMSIAHQYIIKYWDTIKSGDVIDVQFLLGETTEPKQSERATAGEYF